MKKFAGIDVGKAYLDVWLPGGFSRQFSNDDAGFPALLVWLRDNAVEQVACDASSYERHLVRALHAARMPVKVGASGASQGLREVVRSVGEDRPVGCADAG